MTGAGLPLGGPLPGPLPGPPTVPLAGGLPCPLPGTTGGCGLPCPLPGPLPGPLAGPPDVGAAGVAVGVATPFPAGGATTRSVSDAVGVSCPPPPDTAPTRCEPLPEVGEVGVVFEPPDPFTGLPVPVPVPAVGVGAGMFDGLCAGTWAEPCSALMTGGPPMPVPIVRPATTESTAAAAATEPMTRLRIGFGPSAATAAAGVATTGSSGRAFPKVPEVKTSSRVA